MLNGIQAIEVKGMLEISLKSEGNNALITITDTGTGIKGDVIEKIFNPFFTTKESGTGLGLALTHKIIDEHNGSIKVDSQVGKGTKFTAVLPKHLEVSPNE